MIQHVVYLQLEDGEILDRLLKRGRKDDTEEVIRNRLEVYRAETEPLVAWYREPQCPPAGGCQRHG